MTESLPQSSPSAKPEPTFRRKVPKLPPGATFTPTDIVIADEKSKTGWTRQRSQAVNPARRAKKAEAKAFGRPLSPAERERLMLRLEEHAKAIAIADATSTPAE